MIASAFRQSLVDAPRNGFIGYADTRSAGGIENSVVKGNTRCQRKKSVMFSGIWLGRSLSNGWKLHKLAGGKQSHGFWTPRWECCLQIWTIHKVDGAKSCGAQVPDRAFLHVQSGLTPSQTYQPTSIPCIYITSHVSI